VLLETFIRKPLRFERPHFTGEETASQRVWRCGVCPKPCREVSDLRKERAGLTCLCGSGPGNGATARGGWKVPLPSGGETFPGARESSALSHAVAVLAREWSWQGAVARTDGTGRAGRGSGRRWSRVCGTALVRRCLSSASL
jgi:hypothetical protein